MGVDETLRRHIKEWNDFEKGRYDTWITLKTKHEAEVTGRGDTTPEMQKRFDKEIADYSQEWAMKNNQFKERQKIELERELAKETKDKAFKKETQNLNALIQTSETEQQTIEEEQQQPENPEAQLQEEKNTEVKEEPELTEKEIKMTQFLEAAKNKTDKYKSKELER